MVYIGKFKDLTGNKYGDFTVIEMLRNYNNKKRTYCKCIGIDNEYYIIRADALTSGATKNISGVGQKRCAVDITNQKFGKLIAKYRVDKVASNGSVMWYCECSCGGHTIATYTNLKRGHTRSCGCKHRSKWEELISEYLNQYNVYYETEKRFDNCRNKNGSDMLPFDFYIPNLQICIEYDGEHHFYPVKGWGGLSKFKKTQENDSIKNNYCRDNNIRLIRIDYSKKEDEIKKIIDDIMRPATTTVV